MSLTIYNDDNLNVLRALVAQGEKSDLVELGPLFAQEHDDAA